MPEVCFYVKKTISWFSFPLGQVLILWLVGGIVWLRRPHLRIGPVLCLLGSLLLVAYSTPMVSGLLLHGLECRNWDYADAAELSRKGIKYIVVLSGGSQKGPLSATDQLEDATLKRTLEGLRLRARIPEAKLVLSGGNIDHAQPGAKEMEIFLRKFKLTKKAVILETASLDTDDQAKNLSPLLGKEIFALVTSAYHMPRSLYIFRAHGMSPFPAPADFQTKDLSFDLASFVPGPGCLFDSQIAIKEYMGLLWEMLKDLYSDLASEWGKRD